MTWPGLAGLLFGGVFCYAASTDMPPEWQLWAHRGAVVVLASTGVCLPWLNYILDLYLAEWLDPAGQWRYRPHPAGCGGDTERRSGTRSEQGPVWSDPSVVTVAAGAASGDRTRAAAGPGSGSVGRVPRSAPPAAELPGGRR